MEWTDVSLVKICFGELKKGDCFEFANIYFIKIKDNLAFDIINNIATDFQENQQVIYKNCELVVY